MIWKWVEYNKTQFITEQSCGWSDAIKHNYKRIILGTDVDKLRNSTDSSWIIE